MLEGLEDFPETFLSNFKIAPKNQASSFLARIWTNRQYSGNAFQAAEKRKMVDWAPREKLRS